MTVLHIDPGTPALLVRRLSRTNESSSSLERQAADLSRAVLDLSLAVVGDVEDPDVSGAVAPAERPKLGPWMLSPLWESWRVIMVTDLDRLTREQYAWEVFAERCHQGGKEIICLSDPNLDIHTPVGRWTAYGRATMAMEYRQALVRKRLNQRAYYRQEDLWPGGSWPFGYRAEDFTRDGKKRFRLVPDAVTAPLVREAYEKIVDQGWSMRMLAADWELRGVPTSRDHQLIASGRVPEKRRRWAGTAMTKILRSPVLKGIAMHQGEPLLRDGLPVRWADPLLTDVEFDRLQGALDILRLRHPGGRGDVSPINGVFFCGCGRKLHEAPRPEDSGRRSHLRCASVSSGEDCPFKSSYWPRDPTLRMAERVFLDKLGAEEVMERRYIPGADNRQRITELETAIHNLAQSVAQTSSEEVRAALVSTMEQHAARAEELRQEPVVPPRWDEVGTGQTFADRWASMDSWGERGPFLRNLGMRCYLLGLPKGYHDALIFTPRDALTYARDAASGMPVSEDFDAIARAAVTQALAEGIAEMERGIHAHAGS
ncbi:recombinase family protein [Streptomyces sp. UG1]|uniref:recombinase family protein n=1 Tax=Streptomyces sp. UG1 TaxID=3417652 RepID=UPI003CF812D7